MLRVCFQVQILISWSNLCLDFKLGFELMDQWKNKVVPFPSKLHSVGSKEAETTLKSEATKPATISKLKRLFERQFQKLSVAGEWKDYGDCVSGADLEPSSFSFKISFFDEWSSFEKQQRCGCNCFSGNNFDFSSDDDDFADVSPHFVSCPSDVADIVKSLVVCTSGIESNLLSDASKMFEKAKNLKDKDDRLKVIAAGLCAIGYDSSVCKSKWDVAASSPAKFCAIGQHSYIDVIVENGRLILDIDFKSEFEIARSTKSYRAVLQQLPVVFVGTAERLQQIVAIVAEAARQSLKKKGLHVPPWRKVEYMKAKWLSSYERVTAMDGTAALEESVSIKGKSANGDKGSNNNVLNFALLTSNLSGIVDKQENSCKVGDDIVSTFNDGKFEENSSLHVTALPWTPPLVKPKSRTKVVTGLASVL